MANTLRFKRGLVSGIPTAALGEPLFTTDTFDLYIGNGTTNTRFQKYIASGATTQILRGDGSLYTFPLAISSPSAGQVLKYNGTSWVNDSDAGITGSGANGQVAFFTGATTQSGSNNLFWDSAVSRLGVGTNNPAYRFHAISSDASIGAFRNSGAALGQLLVGNTAGDLGIRILATGDGLIFSDTSKYLAFGTNGGSERFRITSGGNFIINNPSTDNGLRFQVTGDGYFSGSVGIARTPSASYKLHVAGDVAYEVTSGNVGFSLISGADSYSFYFNDADNSYRIYSSNGATDRLVLSSSGNLGLGVTPSAWASTYRALQVGVGTSLYNLSTSNGTFLGSNYFFNGTNNIYINTSTATAYGQVSGQHQWFNAPSGTAGNAITFTQAMTLDASGRLGIGTTSPSARLEVSGGRTYLGSSDGYELAFTRTASYFYIYNDGGGVSGKLTFTTSTGITEPILTLTQNTRNVIIGSTSDAGFKLDVNGTMRVSGASTFNGAATFNGSTIYNSGSVIRSDNGTAAAPAITFDSDLNTGIYRIGADNIGITTGGALRLNIDATGAATFSSSVTGASFIPTSSTIPTNGMYLSAANTLAFATASGNKLTISSTGLATFSDSARFSNQKGCIFVQTGGSLLGSISMDSSNQVTIDNNGFFGLSVGSNYTMTGGNLGIGHAQFGTSATRTISVVNGTAPSTSPTDAFQMYSNDVVAGNAAPHFRTENGAVIKLYQETTAVGNSTISVGGGNAVLDDTEFDGYTLRQVVRALRNQGILQ